MSFEGETAPSDSVIPPQTSDHDDAAAGGFVEVLDTILTPGSSLNPAFLLIVDASLALLLAVFIFLLVLTRSLHFVALIAIELGLWASVKWYAQSN